MNTIIHSLGAINKNTGEYVYPKIANKKDEYSCPDCKKDLILCQGEKRVYHFRHKVDTITPCHYYNKPSESQIHKDAKMLMKILLDKKTSITFVRNCTNCKKKEEFEIPETSETSSIHLEYKFDYNGGLKIADVAYIDSNEIVCIFEICNTHKTSSENRPEPWFEIDALTLIDCAHNSIFNSLKIPCIRCEMCEDCKVYKRAYDEYYKKLSVLEKYIFDKLSSFKGDPYDDFLRGDFDYDARSNVKYNQKIIDLFKCDFNGKNVVIHTYKGNAEICITSAQFYKKYNYWHFDSVFNNPTFPCEKRITTFNSGGGFSEASIEIIKLIINYCQFNHETDEYHDCCSICKTTYNIDKYDKDRKNVCNHCEYEARQNTNKSE